ncbi:ABC transporter permease [Mesoaciditoga lauensis]|uniref:ABC transporter permease n=1 Tax=Mesoaciditoga lauensis TaxID=1495039 RepID=UPI000565C4C5|nr:ABC transporter permease [Mesoaciditoga lauensis]
MNLKRKRFGFSTTVITSLVIAALWILLSVTTRTFFTAHNIGNLFSQEAIVGVLTVGQVYVIITAGIDLSVGTVMALSNVVLSLLIVNMGMSIFLAIILSITLATAFGFLNGVIIYELNMPPFIVTLGTMTIALGISLLLTNGGTVSGLPLSFANFGSGSFIGIPNLSWIMIITIIVGEIFLKFSRFGRYVYAIGSNVEAARLSGVNVRRVIYGVYTFSGFLAGIAGLMLTARLWMGVPTAGSTSNLDSIASAAIGGASLFGATGSAVGGFLGATVIATIENGTVLLNISSFWQQVIVGSLIIGTVALDQIRKKQKYTYIKK